ncbi:MAG: twin-arginine translocase TatA/TatE family subunit [Deltaproteobacteria bacterium]|nr:twin-arginine translocase TatA/TatE family subunit [Deltaproteobacteria bacterium]
MFGLGFWEIAAILVLALLVFGPKKLPDLARSLGKSIREFRRATEDFRATMEDEVHRPDPSPRRFDEAQSRALPQPAVASVASALPPPASVVGAAPAATAAPTPALALGSAAPAAVSASPSVSSSASAVAPSVGGAETTDRREGAQIELASGAVSTHEKIDA